MEAIEGLDRHREHDAEVILQVISHEFRANIDHLSSVSPVFKEMLSLEFPQNESRKIRLDNVMPIPVDIFEIFLAAINSSDLSMVRRKNVYGVRALADRFEAPDLLKRCSDFEVAELKEENRRLSRQGDSQNHGCLHVQDVAPIYQENEKLRLENSLLKLQLDSFKQQALGTWCADGPPWNVPRPAENSWLVANEAHEFQHEA